MKKLVVLSAFAFMFIAQSSFAQEMEKKMEVKHEKKMNYLEKELDLTEEQRAQMETIHAKYNPEMIANKREMEKLRGEIKKLQQAQKADVKAILTPEQLKKMETLKKEHMKKRKEAKGHKVPHERNEVK